MQATNMIQNLQWFCKSIPLSCKCAIGILAFMRMVLFLLEILEAQAGDAVSMLG